MKGNYTLIKMFKYILLNLWMHGAMLSRSKRLKHSEFDVRSYLQFASHFFLFQWLIWYVCVCASLCMCKLRINALTYLLTKCECHKYREVSMRKKKPNSYKLWLVLWCAFINIYVFVLYARWKNSGRCSSSVCSWWWFECPQELAIIVNYSVSFLCMCAVHSMHNCCRDTWRMDYQSSTKIYITIWCDAH